MPKRNLDLTSTDACRDLARAVFFSYRTRARSCGTFEDTIADIFPTYFTLRSSMTSVPKPLKFLRPHLQTLKDTFAKMKKPAENKKLLADIISLLAMTDAPVENVIPESLKYRLMGSGEDIGTWGHEVSHNASSDARSSAQSHPDST